MLSEQALSANLDAWFEKENVTELFPPRKDRGAWEGIPEGRKAPWIALAEEYLSYDWPALRMEYYLRVKRHGEIFEPWQAFCKRRSLMGTFLIAECMEGKGRFLDQIINGAFAISEETSWIQMLSIRDNDFALPDEKDNHVDLCSVETAQLFAFSCALLKDELDEECVRIRKRMHDEVLRRVIRPYLDRDDYWWMGFLDIRINNWNPWCNEHIITTIALMDYPASLKAEVIRKVAKSLDVYIERYPSDGACDEGPSYWSAAGLGLARCIELLQRVTGGAVDGTNIEKLSPIGTYYLNAHIAEDWFVNYADGDARLSLSPGVYRFGKLIHSEAMADFGRLAEPRPPVLNHWFSIYDHLVALFDETERASAPAKAPYIERAYLDVCEIMFVRQQGGSKEGFYLSAKGGNNVESHNHNDVGSFIVFLDGQPLFIDLGTEEYTVKTFSKDRFSIWYLQSQYHSCPTIAGRMQHDGSDYYAADTRYETGPAFDKLSMELKNAYDDPPVDSWRREIALYRAEDPRIEIIDTYRGLQEGETSYNFVSHARPEAEGGVIVLNLRGARAALHYDEAALSVRIQRIDIQESRLYRNWGDVVYRIVFTEKAYVKDGSRKFVLRRM